MPCDILLTTVNAKFVHPSLGLRYLMANLGGLQNRARIEEFTAEIPALDIAEALLSQTPKIIGFGVYIWNIRQITDIASHLKALRPEVTLVLGGPEVSHGGLPQELQGCADYVLTGEADLAFGELCAELLEGRRPRQQPEARVIAAPLPELRSLLSPYAFYTDADLKNRLTYVEASRGCPFGCEFCLSALETQVRDFELAPFLAEMEKLLTRGARRFKFVDRTFNLSEKSWRPILEFFLERIELKPFLHFEIVPDRIPEKLIQLAKQFPAGTLQFEVGIQTFDLQTAVRINRKQDFAKTEETLKRLRTETQIHLHADLIAGLPGETLESFASGFDRLVGLGPQDIQVGILKRLKGAPITRHDDVFEMRYSPLPPYEILSNNLLDFATIQKLKRFAPFWERYANTGLFTRSLTLLFKDRSPFWTFLGYSDWLYAQHGRTHSLSLDGRYDYLYQYLTTVLQVDAALVRATLLDDFNSKTGPNRKLPRFAQVI